MIYMKRGSLHSPILEFGTLSLISELLLLRVHILTNNKHKSTFALFISFFFMNKNLSILSKKETLIALNFYSEIQVQSEFNY